MVFRKKKLIFILLFVLMIIPLVSSVPDKFAGTQEGLQIEHPLLNPIVVNQDVKFHFHVFNSTTGLPILANKLTTNCSFHLYNQTGSHLLKVNNIVSSDDIYDWEQIVKGGNFSTAGQYAYVFQCNSSTQGGYFANSLDVRNSLVIETTSGSIINVGLLFILLVFFVFLIWLFFSLDRFKKTEDGRVLDINWLSYLRMPIFALIYGTLMSIFLISSNIAVGYLYTDNFHKLFFALFTIMMRLIIPMIILIGLWLIARIVDDQKIKSMIERGVPIGNL